jgi:hypothetical protein
MTLKLERVNPGDLITARYVNVLVETLEALDARLVKVEGGGLGPGEGLPVGVLTIADISQSQGEAKENETRTYRFELVSTVSETFVPSLRFTNVSGASLGAWVAGSGIDGPPQVPLVAQQRTVVVARVKVPEGATTVDLELFARSLRNPQGFGGSSGIIPIKVGKTTPPSDSRLKFQQEAPNPSRLNFPDPEDPLGPSRMILPGKDAELWINVSWEELGRARFEAELTPTTGGVSIKGVVPTTSELISELTKNQWVAVKVSATQNATAVKRQLTLHAYKVSHQGEDLYHGYFTFPLRVLV